MWPGELMTFMPRVLSFYFSLDIGWLMMTKLSLQKGSPYRITLSEIDTETRYRSILGRRRVEQLKEEVARTLNRSCATKDVIQCVDKLQHLGIAYHFTEGIKSLLDRIADSTVAEDEGLFHAAQRFRVLRNYGYNVAPDLFHKFLNREAKFKDSLAADWRGLLSLHEASHYGTSHEGIMSHAMEFSKKHLKSPKSPFTPQQLAQINHTLELPRHMRMERFEAWRLIQESTHPKGNSSPLLELASLDYNLVQSQHQEELEEFTRWWKEHGLAHKLSFVRDRAQEFFLWTAGIFPQPSFSRSRIELTKSVGMCHLLDDLYDRYGSLEELTLFTDAIKRFAGPVLKICYLIVYNTTNEISYNVLVNSGKCVTSLFRKTYLRNGITSAGTYVVSLLSFLLLGCPISEESLRLVCSRDGLFSHSGRILRLWNDLGTAKAEQQRGDVASSIECYMQERGLADDGDARRHIRGLISTAWKDLNGDALAASPLPFTVVNGCFNLARLSQCFYRYGDDPKAPSVEDIVKALFLKPVK
ncbi:unnamed protein product [Spirodela intermedia]|uniref:Uncharacterized protein n=1 Tax=Spirodela intermedia TaxID=51605 RepID=A0ABN7ECZ0_SPIIN|nr:unnamed protein product [Spirodela intermedia]